jgi:hypothetical protein
VLFYTDGVIEHRGASLDDGMARLRAVATDGPAAPHALCDRVLDALAHDRSDDVALLAVRLDSSGSAR